MEDCYYDIIIIVDGLYTSEWSDEQLIRSAMEYRVGIRTNQNCNTDSTIMLDYREIGMDNTTGLGEWTNLVVIPAQEEMDITNTETVSISADRVQFRFLQLVHGGGVCNRWRGVRLMINNTILFLNQVERDSNNICIINNACSLTNKQNLILYTYRIGEVNDARGLITKVISTSSGSIDGCPGDSNNLLSGSNNTTTIEASGTSTNKCPSITSSVESTIRRKVSW